MKFATNFPGPAATDDRRFATAPARIEHRGELDRLLAVWTGERTVAAAVGRCRVEGVPIAPERR